MRISRTAFPVVALARLALTACGSGGSPAPAPSTTSSGGPVTPGPTPTQQQDVDDDEVDAEPAVVVVTAESLQVFDTDGVAIFGTLYLDDPASLVGQLGSIIGDPVVTTTAGTGSGCDTDQVMYDFGGLLIRSPGLIGTAGDWEVEVSAAVTASGLPISTVAGQQIGASRTAFEAAVGDEVLLGEYPTSHWYGFDIVNPEVDEYEHVGTHAIFDAGVLVHLNTPHLLHADC